MKVLVAGNIGYLTEEWIKKAFDGAQVILAGETELQNGRKSGMTVVPLEGLSYSKLLEVYDVDTVVVFSNQLSFHAAQTGELERLQQILDACHGHGPVKMLYLDGPVAGGSSRKISISSIAARMCSSVSGGDMQIHVLHLPWLCSGAYKDDYFHQLFETLEMEGRFEFDQSANQNACFMDCMDLAELLKRFFEDWPKENEILSAGVPFEANFSDVANALKLINGSWDFSFDTEAATENVSREDTYVNHRYNWYPRTSIINLIPILYQQYQEAKLASKSFRERLSNWFSSHHKLILALEFAATLIITFLCGKLTGLQVQFKFIDYRLLFVVLISTIYGMRMGMLAALCASALLMASYMRSGINWLTVFYEPSNWLVFLAYAMTSIICGYQRLNNQVEMRSLNTQNRRLRKNLQQMQKLYQDVMEEKREYRKQIVSSKDSFGKIFAITQELNVTNEKEIFIKAIGILEKVMENRSVEIYQVDEKKQKLRLVAASYNDYMTSGVSLDMNELSDMIDVLEADDVYVNNHLIEGRPMYAAGMKHNGKMRILVAIRQVEYEQMTLYYLNLFKILCGLISSSLTRALDIRIILREKQCIPGTAILRWNFFCEELEMHRRLAEEKMAVFTLLRLDANGITLGMVDDLIRERTLASDTLGYSPDGQLYLILSQATRETRLAVQKRLAEVGISCKRVSAHEVV